MMGVNQLARACGCDLATINGIENDEIPCDDAYLHRIAHELNVSEASLKQEATKGSVPQENGTDARGELVQDQGAGTFGRATSGGDKERGGIGPTLASAHASTSKEAYAAVEVIANRMQSVLAECATATALAPDDYKLRADLQQLLQAVERIDDLRRDLSAVDNLSLKLKNLHKREAT